MFAQLMLSITTLSKLQIKTLAAPSLMWLELFCRCSSTLSSSTQTDRPAWYTTSTETFHQYSEQKGAFCVGQLAHQLDPQPAVVYSLWTDESTYYVFGTSGNKLIRRPKGQGYNLKYQVPTTKKNGVQYLFRDVSDRPVLGLCFIFSVGWTRQVVETFLRPFG